MDIKYSYITIPIILMTPLEHIKETKKLTQMKIKNKKEVEWEDHKGKKVKLSKMDTLHLINVICYKTRQINYVKNLNENSGSKLTGSYEIYNKIVKRDKQILYKLNNEINKREIPNIKEIIANGPYGFENDDKELYVDKGLDYHCKLEKGNFIDTIKYINVKSLLQNNSITRKRGRAV